MKNLISWAIIMVFVLAIGSFNSCETKKGAEKPEVEPTKLKVKGVDNNGAPETLECTCPCSVTTTSGVTATCE